MSGLENCPSLKIIDIGYCPILRSVKSLAKAQQVIELQITNLKNVTDVETVFSLQNLERLIVENVPPLANADQFSGLKRLKHLAWIGSEINDGKLGIFLHMPDLRHCYIRPNKKHYQPTASCIYETLKQKISTAIVAPKT